VRVATVPLNGALGLGLGGGDVGLRLENLPLHGHHL